MEYSPKRMQDLLSENKFNFKKNFGQNFIIDKNIIDNIINKCNIEKDSLVIEIGPGAGSLTTKLVEKANKVLCYEIDTTLKPILEENLKGYNNVEIVFKDFLNSNVEEDIKKYNYKKLYVIANLPYYITTPIIEKIIDSNILIDQMVFMVQKEVGDRFVAKPNSRDYNSLTIYLNYYFDIKKEFIVNRNSFMPKPNVDSIVVSFKSKENKNILINETLFFKLVRDSFKFKRKNIRNNLKEYDLNIIENILKKYNFDLTVRAEQLSLEIFCDLANNLSK